MGDARETLEGDEKATAAGGIELDADGLLAGKYRIAHLIARGGMGSVWHGTHVTLDRPVAVKFVDVAGRRDELTVERFLREARTAAAIRHPNVVDIVDFGTTRDGRPFMVMELLEGETLLERIRREPRLSTAECVAVMTQVLSGLDAVHRSGIVHRDLKPANVFLSEGSLDGDLFARLLDFGISYSVDPASELRRGQFGTDERVIIGTPEYMSPEQTEGRPDVDMRGDVYSAGVMLYEILSGALPFEGELPGTVMHRVMIGTHVPLIKLRPDIPELAEVVEQAMSLDREQRPGSARELRRQILSVMGLAPDLSGAFPSPRTSAIHRRATPASGTAVSPDAPTGSFDAQSTRSLPPPPTSSVGRWVVGLVTTLALALVLGAAWLSTSGSQQPTPSEPVVAREPVPAPAPAARPPETTVAVTPAVPAPSTEVIAPTVRSHGHGHSTVAAPSPQATTAPAPPATTTTATPLPRGSLVHDLDF